MSRTDVRKDRKGVVQTGVSDHSAGDSEGALRYHWGLGEWQKRKLENKTRARTLRTV